MIFSRLPYRVQIPFGLALAVLLGALMVTAVSARLGAQAARVETLATVDRAARLVGAQALPMLDADDTWLVFALLRSTAALLPGAAAGHARLAVLDRRGRVFASSAPARLATERPLLGDDVDGLRLPTADAVTGRLRLARSDGGSVLIEPIQSEDGGRLGFTYVEIDGSVFAPQWGSLLRPALIGVAMAVLVLVPAGWWIGRRMTAPVANLAQVIGRIGHADASALRARLPHTRDPELGRVSAAVGQLIDALQAREQAERRALSAQRMAAIGRIASAVAHEINNPLGGLLTATQTLFVHGGSEQTRSRTLDLLRRGLNQIQTTVAALLPQARVEQRALELDDFADVVTLAHPDFVHREVQLITQVDVDSALRVPSATLRQVMLNMLLNAASAAGQGGIVRAVLRADAERLIFSVAHAGLVLTQDALEAIVTAESGDNPSGFGLWVCREIATQYGGRFDVDTRHGCGTRLVFWMPNREGHEEPATD